MGKQLADKSLGEKQRDFMWMISLLIQRAYELGYEMSAGDFWAKDGHSKMSCHYIRLAADINLFKDGVYLTETADHEELGIFWEALGGTWGGRFSSPDGNHYSIEHEGRK